MVRSLFLLLPLLLMSCVESKVSYPQKVTDDYTLRNQQVITGDRVPGFVAPSGLIRAVQLTYDASNPVQVFVFETKAASVAFEAMQNWKASNDRRAIQVDRFFIEAETVRPDPKALDAFLTEFEKKLR